MAYGGPLFSKTPKSPQRRELDDVVEAGQLQLCYALRRDGAGTRPGLGFIGFRVYRGFGFRGLGFRV